MKLQWSSLRSRVARRVFVLFVLSALIPVSAAAILAYIQVNSELAAQTRTQLHYTSKSYGMGLIGRLLDIEGRLRNYTSDLTNSTLSENSITEELRGKVNAVARVADAQRFEPIFGQVPKVGWLAIDPSLIDRSLLYSHSNLTQEPKVFIAMSVKGAGGTDYSTFIAELNQQYVWGSKNLLPEAMGLAIVDDTGPILFSSQPVTEKLSDYLAPKLAESSTGYIEWSAVGEDFLADYWEIFLKSSFTSSDWTVVAFQAESEALSSIAGFKRVFFGVIVLSILTVMLLSATQIRRQLIPLESLMAATRRLANKQFDEKVIVNSNDEFQDLAESFNTMAVSLGRQFNSLTALSEIDKRILSTNGLDSVLEVALNYIQEMVSCDAASITIFEQNTGQDMPAYIGVSYCSDGNLIERVTLNEDDAQMMLAGLGGVCLEINDDKPFFAHFKQAGMQSANLLPIIIDESLAGFISLAYLSEQEINTDYLESLSLINDFADRLAVALSAAEHEEKLYQQAHHDSLTGLPNRHLLGDRLKQEIARAARENRCIALIFLDLDRFKHTNDTLGHAAGDQLLKQTAQRLVDCAREVDTVARLGGDEFTMVLTEVSGPNDVRIIAERVIETLSDPFVIDGHEFFLSASLGITLYPGGGDTAEDMLKNADIAMYSAKENGRNQYVFFEEKMNNEAMERSLLERDLRHALLHDEFVLHYQPQVDMDSGKVVSAEALIRWPHPTRGQIRPDQFIPLAEDIGLVNSLGEWVLRTACEQYLVWHAQGITLDHVAVNVSGRQFKQDNFIDIVKNVLRETGLPPNCLELELTEGTLMETNVDTVEILQTFRDMNIKLSIDDFGTGYSSLAYLKRFPIDTLKIDQSFIRDLPADEDSIAITTSIIALAKALRKQVVAEGVETEEQLLFLREHKCDLIQGYYYSPALPAMEFSDFVNVRSENLIKQSVG